MKRTQWGSIHCVCQFLYQIISLTGLSVGGGRNASFLFEDLAQILLTTKARFLGHGGQRDLRIPQKLFCRFNATVDQIFVRRHSRGL